VIRQYITTLRREHSQLDPQINWGPGPLHPLVLSADAMFLYCSYIVFTSAHSAQKYAKIAIFIALFAFIPGVI
ncbi:MAG: hypothetical protein IJX35_03665, partial [Candidatus Methanomethylophilaceae archaeon]|nr:hypothetical protein [Candidatus Methanomethylophilaceae archaeon]